MAFRDDLSALETRHEALERELSDIRERKRELDGLDVQEKELERRLQETTELLVGKRSRRRRLNLLDDLRIASPCDVPWDEMAGTERVRFCGKCEKNVYNLSAMAREEAEEFLLASEGRCVYFSRRLDGKIISNDCPVGMRIRRAKRRKFALIAVGGGLLATGAGAFAFTPRQCRMIEVAIPVPNPQAVLETGVPPAPYRVAPPTGGIPPRRQHADAAHEPVKPNARAKGQVPRRSMPLPGE